MILDKIVNHKKLNLPSMSDFGEPPLSTRDFKACLKGRHNIIAEIKRKSPSKGNIARLDVGTTALKYYRYANAISVLTDLEFFGGALEDIRTVKEIVPLPVLRKDFIIDPAQVVESRHYGADAILLIAAISTKGQITEYLDLARQYGMDCLVEVHNEGELEMVLQTDADIIGINNRNLQNMEIDIETTMRLKKMIPRDKIVVSESGISTIHQIQRVDTNGVLIGTSLMSSVDIEAKLQSLRVPKVKVCGVTTLEDAQRMVDCGVDFIGFNFYEPSPRYIPPGEAALIIDKLPNTVTTVGVFVNEEAEKVKSMAAQTGVDMLQFHGDEPPEYCNAFDKPVIKAFRVKNKLPEIGDYNVFGFLPDAFVPGLYGGTGKTLDWSTVENFNGKLCLSGGLNCDNISDLTFSPYMVDVCSGVEKEKGVKDAAKTARFVRRATDRTRFGVFGGGYVPETLITALQELDAAYLEAIYDRQFREQLDGYLKEYAGRSTPLYYAGNFSKEAGCRVYLKREDLLHGGAHKTNNVIGQALLAQRMGKKRIIAETGAGQHGIAVAMAGALFGFETEVYMGVEDIRRQAPNVQRMRLCGAKVNPVEINRGQGSLKDAVSEALRDWTTNVENTYYMLGSVAGPHPYPALVRDLQDVIGREAREQILAHEGRLPHYVVACVGGGSNAIGIFNAFLRDKEVRLVGVEAGGNGVEHGATLSKGSMGVFQGAATYMLQDSDGQVREAASISAGLDYPGVGPQHAFLKQSGRAHYDSVTDETALKGFRLLSRCEGIVPALESSHALGYVLERDWEEDDIVVVNLSGRGDKDLNILEELL